MSFIRWSTIEYHDNEVVVYQEGAQFPMKTAPTPEILYAIDIVKKNIIESIKLFPFSIAFKLLRKKSLTNLLTSFNRIGFGVLEPYMYYQKIGQGKLNLTKTARGVGQLTELFLIKYGVDQEVSHKTAELIAHIVEFDGFYRFKILDLLSEIKWYKAIENPRKEIQRLINICYEREQIIPTYIRPKLEIMHKLAWILEFPSLKKALSYAFKYCNPVLFRIDESDYYWMLQRGDYHYFGKSLSDRMEIIKEKGWSLPIYRDENENVIENG